MKKFISILLALMLVMSLGTAAFAEGETYTDMRTVTITKNYEATNSGTVSPEETFTFTIVARDVTDAAEGVNTGNMPLPTIEDVTYAAGEAGSVNKSKEITITLPEYNSVGIYTYTINENVGTTAGVEYYGENILLKVTVIEQDGKVRVAAVHTEEGFNGNSTDGTKSSKITNIYSAGSLAVTKTVGGNLGDKSKYFEFKVTLTGEEGKTYAESFAVSGGSNNDNPKTIKIGEETTFLLKDGETISIANIPYNVTYTVTETAVEGYETTKTGDRGTINAAAQTAAFTNIKEGDIDTGISLDSLPYILMLVVVGAAIVVVSTRKKGEQF